ncbi:MAG: divergent polysaccharide deacetylase family protein [Roseobacter sp.]
MARGFLKGAVWGSAVSICALGVASTLAERSQLFEPSVAAPEPAAVPKEHETTVAVEDLAALTDPAVAEPEPTVVPEKQETTVVEDAVPEPDQPTLDPAVAPREQEQTAAVQESEPVTDNPVTEPAPVVAPKDQETTASVDEPMPAAGQPIAAPQPDTLVAVPEAATAPAAQPETGPASDLSDPDLETATANIETSAGETPVVSREQATGLQAPSVEPSVTVSTEPAQPASPSVNAEIALSVDPVQPTAPSGDESAFGAKSETEEPESAPGVATSISQDPDQPKAPAIPSETQAFETPTLEVEAGQAPQQSRVNSQESPVSEEITVSPVIGAAPVLETGVGPFEPEPGPQPQTEAPPEAASEDRVLVLRGPVGTVGNLAPEVEVNRLPTLGGATEDVAARAAPDTDRENDAAPNALRPVEQFAAMFENTSDKPVMAIVLMDEGVNLSRDTIGLPALRSFPYPISFAVDTKLPDAQDRMEAYRAEGFEVLALIDLPEGATARDAEVTLAAALDTIPEAVGVLEGVGEGLQGTRDAAQQVTEILAQTGHGFVTQNQGLNTVQKLAAKSGVPSAVVFRDFDSAEQTPTVIRRFLDQAAFRAGREGGVIMLGRLREDTISALLIWGLQDRAKTVALVPVSAALQSQ